MNEVLPGLYLGSRTAGNARNLPLLQKCNVKSILVVATEEEVFDSLPDVCPVRLCNSDVRVQKFVYGRISISDNKESNLLAFLDSAIEFIDDALKKGAVLVQW